MGSGASNNKPIKPKQENRQQPLSTQNKTNITRPNASSPRLLANTSRKPLRPIQTPMKQDRKQSINNSQISLEKSATLLVRTPSSQVQNRSPSVTNETAGARKIKVLPNGTPASSYQQNNNSDDDEVQLVPMNNFQKTSNKNSLSSNPVTPLPPINSNTSTKRRTSVDEKSNLSLAGHTGRCSHCPHCKLLPKVINNKPTDPEPVWITEPPSQAHQHIIMDDYDEEAVRKKIISERGRLPGIYDYPPNLTIEENNDQNEISKKYLRLPIIAKPESPMSPARTPFPDYNTLQYRETHLNKPYTSTLFTD